MDVVTSVKLAIYDHFAETSHAPTVTDIATKLRVPAEEVQHASATQVVQ